MIPLAVGGGSVPVVLPGVANMDGNPSGARQGRVVTWRRGAGWGSVRGGGRLLAGVAHPESGEYRDGSDLVPVPRETEDTFTTLTAAMAFYGG